jgi:hypothetical protein
LDWTTVSDCSGALRLGWLIGVGSGLSALVFLVILDATAPSYHLETSARRGANWHPSDRVRKRWQLVLLLAQFAVPALWMLGLWRSGVEQSFCYVPTAALGTVVVLLPFLIGFILTAANLVGQARAQ